MPTKKKLLIIITIILSALDHFPLKNHAQRKQQASGQ